MIVFFDELYGYMVFRAQGYLNTITGACVYDNEDFDYANHPDYIPIPKINSNYAQGFISEITDKTLRRKLCSSLDNGSYSQAFHMIITDNGLYSSWIDYVDNCDFEFARKWCESNGIKCVGRQKV